MPLIKNTLLAIYLALGSGFFICIADMKFSALVLILLALGFFKLKKKLSNDTSKTQTRTNT